MHKTLSITFLSDWQIASGLGDSHLADSVPIRDADGFPYIPGRALKGALREGAWRLSLCRQDLQKAEFFFWGSRSQSESANKSGIIRLSSATLIGEVKQVLLTVPCEQRKELLSIRRIQTALDEKMQVVRTSLRTLECSLPGLVFTAELDVPVSPELEQWTEEYFRAVCAAVKSMGGKRARGLGRCKVSFLGEEDCKASVPVEEFAI